MIRSPPRTSLIVDTAAVYRPPSPDSMRKGARPGIRAVRLRGHGPPRGVGPDAGGVRRAGGHPPDLPPRHRAGPAPRRPAEHRAPGPGPRPGELRTVPARRTPAIGPGKDGHAGGGAQETSPRPPPDPPGAGQRRPPAGPTVPITPGLAGPPVRDGIVPHRPSHELPGGGSAGRPRSLDSCSVRRAIRRLLAGDRADRTAVDADVALGVPALAPGMLDRLAAPGLREADLIEPRPQGHRATAPEA